MSFLTLFPKETEMHGHRVFLYACDPVIVQILWPALTKFDRGVQIALSCKVPTHFHRDGSLGRKGGLRKPPTQGKGVVRSLRILGTKQDTAWIPYSQQNFTQSSGSSTKHKSLETAGRAEGRLTKLFGLVFLRTSRAWPQLRKGADRPELKGGGRKPPLGALPGAAARAFAGTGLARSGQGVAAKSEGRDLGEG